MFVNCNNLSFESYANLTYILSIASELTNQCISNTGLNINIFTTEQISILNTKGYKDVIPKTYQAYFEIELE